MFPTRALIPLRVRGERLLPRTEGTEVHVSALLLTFGSLVAADNSLPVQFARFPSRNNASRLRDVRGERLLSAGLWNM